LFLILGILFYINILQASANNFAPEIQAVIGPLVTLLIFTTPALTMRLLADEQRMGTLELLLTSPVKDFEIVVGKWLGGWLFLVTILLLSWVYPLIMNQLVSPGIDQGTLLAVYLGLFLLTASFIAIGVAISAMFSNQIAAFFLSVGVLLVFWIIGYPATFTSGGTADILRYLDMSEHFYNTFYRGIIELKDIIFYLSITTLSLVLGSTLIETRRWR
jgi:ABC-2 type transport system permease protein